MSYKINLGAWGSVFAVPSALVDSHLKIATESQLKVLLYILRNSDSDNSVDSISKAVSVHPDEVKNAVNFWVERGLVASTSDSLTFTQDNNSEERVVESVKVDDEPVKKPRQLSRPQKPDHSFVAKRLYESKELSQFMDEVQLALANPISDADTATLIMLHDTDGLPCDVLMLLINYCISIGKGNMRAIERMGTQWGAEGIYTLQLAEEKIIRLSQSDNAWTRVSKLFGIKNIGTPTKAQLTFADTWCNDWKFSDDMLLEAYERCVNTKGEYNIKYINAILSKWHSSSIYNLDDLRKADESIAKKRKGRGKSEPERTASYDINDFDNNSLFAE